METFPSVSEESPWITLGLFRDVSNASSLRNEAAGGRLEAALLDPSLIVSPFHVLAAASKAILARDQKQMKTRNMYSEIIYCLSPSTNISNSFKTFGVKDESRDMLAVLVHNQQHDGKISLVSGKVQGTATPLSSLANICRHKEIIKVYGISSEEQEISSLENSVVTKLAIKDIL